MHRPGDGDQDLTMVLRDPATVFRELLSDPRGTGSQYFCFEEYRNEEGQRVFYHSNGSLTYQQAQEEADPEVSPVSLVLCCDGTYGQKSLPYRKIGRAHV